MFPSSELRFRSGIALVAIATVFVGLAAWRLWPGGSAEEEFQKAAKALADVKSFRYEYADLAGARPNRESREVVCPARQHVSIASASGDRGLWEYIFIEGYAYHKTPRTDGWRSYANEFGLDLGLDPRALCDRVAAGQDTGPFPLYKTLLKRGFARRGELKAVEGGGQCREWKVSVPRMGMADDSESFCLDTRTYLPVYRLTVSARYSFSDFNAPLTIEAPWVPPQ